MLQVSHEHLSLRSPKFTPSLHVEPIIVNSLYMDSEKEISFYNEKYENEGIL